MYLLSPDDRTGSAASTPAARYRSCRLLLGRGDLVLDPGRGAVGPICARAATHGRIENCGQPQAHLEATSDVSARRRVEACGVKPAQRRKEECTGKAPRDAL